MTRQLRRWLMVCGLAGLTASAASAYVQCRMLQDPSYEAFCRVNSVVDCGAALGRRTLEAAPWTERCEACEALLSEQGPAE